eukprot:TRINITY_DN24580_c0_g1_i1.p1 TRINITY_DN24580_c0_g1~~TRINITY_DN24580_c0_g1_i1.p1  ORF type:complete len:1181 (+),score=51.65 TRINITY_DN24580_c0_g1_i1:67-3609(+)
MCSWRGRCTARATLILLIAVWACAPAYLEVTTHVCEDGVYSAGAGGDMLVSINGGPDTTANVTLLGGSNGRVYSFNATYSGGPVLTVRIARSGTVVWDGVQLCGFLLRGPAGFWNWGSGTGVWFDDACPPTPGVYPQSFTWEWTAGNTADPTIVPNNGSCGSSDRDDFIWPAPTASPTARPSDPPTRVTAEPSRPSSAPLPPSVSPTSSPTRVPAPPTPAPSAVPVPPSSSPSILPTGGPTQVPSASPQAEPTGLPSTSPTGGPVPNPTVGPSLDTVAPTWFPRSRAPTSAPVLAPSAGPLRPSGAPTTPPRTAAPSSAPALPTWSPVNEPSGAPRAPTLRPLTVAPPPTDLPTQSPVSAEPSVGPSQQPAHPTRAPSAQPSLAPSVVPALPTGGPVAPTTSPCSAPTPLPSSPEPSSIAPSWPPAQAPSTRPSAAPTVAPLTPTAVPAAAAPAPAPSRSPSRLPTRPAAPSTLPPTRPPQRHPSAAPTPSPAAFSAAPSAAAVASLAPTGGPEPAPTAMPERAPSAQITTAPAAPPTRPPGLPPSAAPSFAPSAAPRLTTSAPSAAPVPSPATPPPVGSASPSGFRARWPSRGPRRAPPSTSPSPPMPPSAAPTAPRPLPVSKAAARASTAASLLAVGIGFADGSGGSASHAARLSLIDSQCYLEWEGLPRSLHPTQSAIWGSHLAGALFINPAIALGAGLAAGLLCLGAGCARPGHVRGLQRFWSSATCRAFYVFDALFLGITVSALRLVVSPGILHPGLRAAGLIAVVAACAVPVCMALALWRAVPRRLCYRYVSPAQGRAATLLLGPGEWAATLSRDLVLLDAVSTALRSWRQAFPWYGVADAILSFLVACAAAVPARGVAVCIAVRFAIGATTWAALLLAFRCWPHCRERDNWAAAALLSLQAAAHTGDGISLALGGDGHGAGAALTLAGLGFVAAKGACDLLCLIYLVGTNRRRQVQEALLRRRAPRPEVLRAVLLDAEGSSAPSADCSTPRLRADDALLELAEAPAPSPCSTPQHRSSASSAAGGREGCPPHPGRGGGAPRGARLRRSTLAPAPALAASAHRAPRRRSNTPTHGTGRGGVWAAAERGEAPDGAGTPAGARITEVPRTPLGAAQGRGRRRMTDGRRASSGPPGGSPLAPPSPQHVAGLLPPGSAGHPLAPARTQSSLERELTTP